MAQSTSEAMESALGWTRRPLSLTVRIVVTLLVLFVFAGPFLVIVAGAFDQGFSARDVSIFPSNPTLDNFALAASVGIFDYLGRSLVIVGGGLLLQVVVSVLAAYALSQFSFRGRALIMGLFLLTIMVPEEMVAIPLSLVLSDLPLLGLDLRGSVWGVILPVSAWGFSVILMAQFMAEVPREIIEAARLDGVGNLRMLWSIVLPLSRSALGVIVIFGFIMIWDQYLLPLIAARGPEDHTLTVALRGLSSQLDIGAGVVMAGALLALVPSVLVYLFLQRSLVRGITAGAVK